MCTHAFHNVPVNTPATSAPDANGLEATMAAVMQSLSTLDSTVLVSSPPAPDAPEAQVVPSSPPQPFAENASTFFALFLPLLRRVCTRGGLDFDALAQSDLCDPMVEDMEQSIGLDLIDALGIETSKDETATAEDVAEQLSCLRDSLTLLVKTLVLEKTAPKTRGYYIGNAQFLYESRKEQLLDIFRRGCLDQTTHLDIHIEYPQGLYNIRTKATLQASVPRPDALCIVDIGEDTFYRLAFADTWQEAVELAGKLPVTYGHTRGIYPMKKDRVLNNVNMLTFYENKPTMTQESD